MITFDEKLFEKLIEKIVEEKVSEALSNRDLPQAKEAPTTDFIPKKHARQMFDISDATICRYHQKGIINLYRFGGKVFLKKSELEKGMSRGVQK